MILELNLNSRVFDIMKFKTHQLLPCLLAIIASASSGHISNEAFIKGFSGFYEMDRNLHSSEEQSKWYTVQITWKESKGTFKWQNRAGVTWTLTPLSGSTGGWDEKTLTVGNDCPYKNEGHEVAMIEWVSSALSQIFIATGLCIN